MENFEAPDNEPPDGFEPSRYDNEIWDVSGLPDGFADTGIIPEHEYQADGQGNENDAEARRLLSEARMVTLSESNPKQRVYMALAMVNEGDHSMAAFAHAALCEMPSIEDQYSGASSIAKIIVANDTLDVFAAQGLYSEADQVIDAVHKFDSRTGLRGICRLLRGGYAGPGGAYLQLDFDKSISDARIMGINVDSTVFTYLEACAAYGEDILDPNTHAGRIYKEAITVTDGCDNRNQHIAYYCAEGGHTDNAVAVRRLIADPLNRGFAGIKIAETAQLKGDTDCVNTLIAELLEDANAVRRETDNFTAETDALYIEAGVALVAAKEGRIDMAKSLVGTTIAEASTIQLPAHIEIYRQTGDAADRTTAVAAIGRFGSIWSSPFVAGLAQQIGVIDKLHGNVLPSVVADEEYIPLVCWEIRTLFGQKDSPEELEEFTEASEAVKSELGRLGLDPTSHDPALLEKRIETRDRTIVELMRLIQGDAPKTALKMLEAIQNPIEKVRALTLLSHASGRIG